MARSRPSISVPSGTPPPVCACGSKKMRHDSEFGRVDGWPRGEDSSPTVVMNALYVKLGLDARTAPSDIYCRS